MHVVEAHEDILRACRARDPAAAAARMAAHVGNFADAFSSFSSWRMSSTVKNGLVQLRHCCLNARSRARAARMSDGPLTANCTDPPISADIAALPLSMTMIFGVSLFFVRKSYKG
jgi:hypothetical protein